MADLRLLRLQRELFLAAFGLRLDVIEPWVIDRITTLLDEQEITAGQTLFSADEPPEHLYFMQSGAVRLSRKGHPSWTFRGRWVLGGFDAVLDRASTRRAVALVDFHALRLPANAWTDLLEDCFPLARGAVTALGRAVSGLESRAATGPAPAARPDVWVPPSGGPLTLIERLALLAQVEMFRSAGVQVLADLAAVSREVSFQPGQTLLERDAPWSNMLVVVEGEVQATRSAPDALRQYGFLDVVCGAVALGDSAPAWQASASTPTRALLVPVESWFDLMEDHFDLFRSLLGALALRREALLDHLARESGGIELT